MALPESPKFAMKESREQIEAHAIERSKAVTIAKWIVIKKVMEWKKTGDTHSTLSLPAEDLKAVKKRLRSVSGYAPYLDRFKPL